MARAKARKEKIHEPSAVIEYLHLPLVKHPLSDAWDALDPEALHLLSKETLTMEIKMWAGQERLWAEEMACDNPSPQAKGFLDEAIRNLELFREALKRSSQHE